MHTTLVKSFKIFKYHGNTTNSMIKSDTLYEATISLEAESSNPVVELMYLGEVTDWDRFIPSRQNYHSYTNNYEECEYLEVS